MSERRPSTPRSWVLPPPVLAYRRRCEAPTAGGILGVTRSLRPAARASMVSACGRVGVLS